MAEVKQNFLDRDFALGLNNLQNLRDKVEAHYLTLNPAQKANWEDTREKIQHIREHAAELRADRRTQASTEEQRIRVRRLLQMISVI